MTVRSLFKRTGWKTFFPTFTVCIMAVKSSIWGVKRNHKQRERKHEWQSCFWIKNQGERIWWVRSPMGRKGTTNKHSPLLPPLPSGRALQQQEGQHDLLWCLEPLTLQSIKKRQPTHTIKYSCAASLLGLPSLALGAGAFNNYLEPAVTDFWQRRKYFFLTTAIFSCYDTA